MIKASYQYLVDWNGNGAFNHPYSDISPYVLTASWYYGRPQGDTAFDNAGRVTIVLDNSSGIFSPFNASSPIYGLIRPDIKVKLIMTVGVTQKTKFCVDLEDIVPVVGATVEVSTATLTGKGVIERLSKAGGEVARQESIKEGAAIDAILTADGIPAGSKSIAVGLTTLANWWLRSTTTKLQAIRELQAAGFGRFREGMDGRYVYDDRDYVFTPPNNTPKATYGGPGGLRMYQLRQLTQYQGLYDVARGNVRTFNISDDTVLAVIADVHNKQGTSAPPIVPPKAGAVNGTLNIWVNCPSQFVGVHSWGTVDLEANRQADAQGDDITVYVSATLVPYGDRAELRFVNTSPYPAHLVTLRVHGVGIIEGDPIPLKAGTGTREYPNASQWSTDLESAQQELDYAIALYGHKRPALSFVVKGNYDLAHLTEVQARDLADRIHVTAGAEYGLYIDDDFIVDRISHAVDEGRVHSMTVECTVAPTEQLGPTGKPYSPIVPNAVLPSMPTNVALSVSGVNFFLDWGPPAMGAYTLEDACVQFAEDAAFTTGVITRVGLGKTYSFGLTAPGKTYYARVAWKNSALVASHAITAAVVTAAGGAGTYGWGPFCLVVGPQTSSGISSDTLTDELLSLIAAGGEGVTIYYQEDEPPVKDVGDIWYETDQVPVTIYRWNGTAWADITSDVLSAALTAASSAQATADGKIVTFAQTSQPTATAIGDLWIDTDNHNKLYRWNGTQWLPYQDTHNDAAIASHASQITSLTTAVASKITIFYQTSQPTANVTGDIWYDTDATPVTIKRWNGSTWVDITTTALSAALDAAADAQAIADGKIVTFAQTSQPTATAIGDLWIDTDNNNKLYRWSGSSWVAYQDTHLDSTVSSHTTQISNLTTSVNQKITIFYQTSQPTANVTGDIWYDTDASPVVIYRWNGSAWVDITTDTLSAALTAAANASNAALDAHNAADAAGALAQGTNDLVQLAIAQDGTIKNGKVIDASIVGMNVGKLIGQIVDTQIANVSGAKLIAGSVPVRAMGFLPTSGALNPDPNCTDETAWTTYSGSNWELATVEDGKIGNSVIRSTGAPGLAGVQIAQPIPISPTKSYLLHGAVRRKSGDRRVYFFVRFFDSSGTVINPTGLTGWPNVTSARTYWVNNLRLEQLPVGGEWQDYYFTCGYGGTGEIPENAKSLQIGAFLNLSGAGDGTTTDGVVEIQDFWIKERIDSDKALLDGIIGDSHVSSSSSIFRKAIDTLDDIAEGAEYGKVSKEVIVGDGMISISAIGGETPSGAQQKADAAEEAAKQYADAQDAAEAVRADAYADGVATVAEQAAIAAAEAYADQKKTEAEAYADGVADAAEQAAIAAAKAYADQKKTEAQAYADGIVDDAEAAAIAAAKAYTDAASELAETTAKAYADGLVDAEEARAIADAQAKADAAEAAAKQYADMVAEEALNELSSLATVVNSKITIFYQASQPVATATGDIWYDTDANPVVIYRWNGSTWVDITTNALSAALDAAGDAQATADGKINTYAQASQPTASAAGDLWIDTDDNNKLYRWNGTQWLPYQDTHNDAAIASHASQITNLTTAVASKITIFYQPNQPTANVTGDIWYDTDATPVTIKRWNGSTWVDITTNALSAALAAAGDAQATADRKINTYAQTSAPTAEAAGDLWVDTNDGNKLYRWSGSAWVSIQDALLATHSTQISNLTTSVNQKITIFYQASQPTANVIGDIWYDTDTNPVEIKRWDGSTWADITTTALSAALDAAADAQAVADGKIVTFAQDAQPTATAPGDLWIDTDNNNKLYRWNGSAWVSVQDTHLDSTVSGHTTQIANLVSEVTSKITIFYQTSQPTAKVIGDIWYDTDADPVAIKRWNGSTWVDITTTALSAALAAASSAQATADGKIVTFAQADEPTATSIGDLWIKTTENNKLYRWSGSAWTPYQDTHLDSTVSSHATQLTALATAVNSKITIFYQPAQPTANVAGDIWYDTDANPVVIYRWNGSSWVNITTTALSAALDAAGDAQATADGKIITFAQAAQPTAVAVGDLWIDTDDGNRLYRWSGSAWVDVRDAGIAQTLDDLPDGTEYKRVSATNIEAGKLLLASTEYGLTRIANPIGAVLSLKESYVTGAIVITLPQSWSRTMMKFMVDVYTYTNKKSFSLALAGYNYDTGACWLNTSVALTGSAESNNRVRFGHDGEKCCVVIGDTDSVWRYPKVSVRDFQAGFNNIEIDKWKTGWNISIVTDLTGYTFPGPDADFADSLVDAKKVVTLSNHTLDSLPDGVENKHLKAIHLDADTGMIRTSALTGTVTAETIIQPGSITTSLLDFTPVGSNEVIARINASEEGLKIASSKIKIDGSTEFVSGYDPSTKIEIGGAAEDINEGSTRIDGGMIETGTILASRMYLTANDLFPDPCFDDPDMWTHFESPWAAGDWMPDSGVARFMGVRRAAALWGSIGTESKYCRSKEIPFSDGGKTVTLSTITYNTSNHPGYMYLVWVANDGTLTWAQPPIIAPTGTYRTARSQQYTAPNDVRGYWIQFGNDADGQPSFIPGMAFSEIRVRIAADAELIVDGAIVTRHIAAGQVTAEKCFIQQLSSLTADLGAVTAGVITGSTFRLSPDANGNFIELSGSTIKYKNQWGVVYYQESTALSRISFPIQRYTLSGLIPNGTWQTVNLQNVLPGGITTVRLRPTANNVGQGIVEIQIRPIGGSVATSASSNPSQPGSISGPEANVSLNSSLQFEANLLIGDSPLGSYYLDIISAS